MLSTERQDVFVARISLAVASNHSEQFLLAAKTIEGGVTWERLIALRSTSDLAFNRKSAQFSRQYNVALNDYTVAYCRLELVGGIASFHQRITPAKPNVRIPIGLPGASLALKRHPTGSLVAIFAGDTFDFGKYAILVHLDSPCVAFPLLLEPEQPWESYVLAVKDVKPANRSSLFDEAQLL